MPVCRMLIMLACCMLIMPLCRMLIMLASKYTKDD